MSGTFQAPPKSRLEKLGLAAVSLALLWAIAGISGVIVDASTPELHALMLATVTSGVLGMLLLALDLIWRRHLWVESHGSGTDQQEE